MPTKCTIPDCPRRTQALGFCIMHAKRLRKHGSPLVVPKWGKRPAAERFVILADIRDGCWQWLGHVGANGYGHLAIASRPVLAHRFAYELVYGAIPEGLQIDHLCMNKSCVRPDHMEVVSAAVNTARAMKVSNRWLLPRR